MKKLAICVPTYNRSKLLDRLLKSIPSKNDIMVSICDDGSNDNTVQIVRNHESRISIKYFYQKNKGRASALRKSILNSKAKFILIADSDDYFEKNGIETILKFIENNTTISFFVFPIRVKQNSKFLSVSLAGIPKTNYIKLRSDYKIKYDLQEVIQTKLLLDILYDDPVDIRRIPTSYLWFKASSLTECLPVDSVPVKTKEYFSDGLTANLLPMQVRYPKYLAYTYQNALKSKQFSSLFYRLKFSVLFYRFSFHNKTLKLLSYKDLPLFMIGCIYGFWDLLRLVIFYR